MIRQNFCPKCQQITNQKTTKGLNNVVTRCEQCLTTLNVEYKARKPLQNVSKKQAKRNRELAKIEPPPDNRCQSCGELPDFRGLAKHHKIFRSHGGSDTMECKYSHVSQYQNQFKLQEKIDRRNKRIARQGNTGVTLL